MRSEIRGGGRGPGKDQSTFSQRRGSAEQEKFHLICLLRILRTSKRDAAFAKNPVDGDCRDADVARLGDLAHFLDKRVDFGHGDVGEPSARGRRVLDTDEQEGHPASEDDPLQRWRRERG